jgi:hypothetical protein
LRRDGTRHEETELMAAPAVAMSELRRRADLDALTANRMVLREAGLADERISVAAIPTRSGAPGLFFSDREVRPCGRFAAIAWLRSRGGR